jgi:hypothetical protein
MGGGIPKDFVWEYMRCSRAAENSVYLASACSGLFTNAPYGTHVSMGGSEIIDYEGRVLMRADGPGETTCSATVDINALRHFRNEVIAGKMIARLETDLYKLFYEDVTISKPNLLLDERPQHLMDLVKKARKASEHLKETGLLIPPQ